MSKLETDVMRSVNTVMSFIKDNVSSRLVEASRKNIINIDESE